LAGIETLLNKVFDAVRNRLRADVEVTAALPAGANKIGVVDAQLLGSTGGQVTVTDGKLDVNAQVTVSAVTTGSDMELYGKTLDDRPAANTMKAGTTFTIVDAILDQNWISDGTDWLEV